MSYRSYHLKRGDLVHLNFSPSAGRETADGHYALVVSATSYNRKTGMAVVCAITSRVRGGPFEMAVPPGLLPDKAGVGKVNRVVVADAVRQVNYRERETAFVATMPKSVVEDVLDKLFAVMEDE